MAPGWTSAQAGRRLRRRFAEQRRHHAQGRQQRVLVPVEQQHDAHAALRRHQQVVAVARQGPAMRQQPRAAQPQLDQAQAVGARGPADEGARRRQPLQNSSQWRPAAHERPGPARQRCRAACDAAGRRHVHPVAAPLPPVRSRPVSRRQSRHRLRLVVREGHSEIEWPEQAALQQLGVGHPGVPLQHRLAQPPAGVGVCHLHARPGAGGAQPVQGGADLLGRERRGERHAELPVQFHHVRQAAGHVQRPPQRDRGERIRQAGQQGAERHLQPDPLQQQAGGKHVFADARVAAGRVRGGWLRGSSQRANLSCQCPEARLERGLQGEPAADVRRSSKPPSADRRSHRADEGKQRCCCSPRRIASSEGSGRLPPAMTRRLSHSAIIHCPA